MKTITRSLVIVIMTTSMGCSGADDGGATDNSGAPAVADSGGSSEWNLDSSTSSDEPFVPDTGSASPSAPSDAGVPSTEVGGDSGKATCGTEVCNMLQDCCAASGTSKCVPKGTCAGTAPASCTDPSSCGSGEVCCKGLTAASCAKSCALGLRLCTSDAQCKTGESCASGLGGTRYCAANPLSGLPGFDAGAGGG